MNYRTYSDLIRASEALCARIDPPEQIYGVPRSGLLLATMMALKWNVPLCCVGSVDGDMTMTRDVSSGSRIILVDDSINSGQTMRKSVDVVSARIGEKPVTVCAYACDATKSLVDFYYESVPFPRVWEWNVFHHILLRVAGCDIDGVICPEPRTDEQSDPAGYVREIESAPYIRRITYKVRAFVTSRLEKHRASTENWLRSHGVRYDELVMSRHADVESRRAFSDHAKQKAQAIVSRGLQMFIESSSEQAQAISLFARVPVLCTDTNTMHNPKG